MLTPSKKMAVMQVSKWVKIPFLAEVEEIRELITGYAPPFKLYDVQKITQKGSGVYSPEEFLECYSSYVNYLKNGEIPPLQEFRSLFSAVWSVADVDALEVDADRHLFKPSQPVVQSQFNQIRYAREEKIFRTQVFSSDSISWGIQIGFPFLFLNPETFEAEKTHSFPNMPLFTAFQKWIRKFTVPTPFFVDGERINAPIRLGKSCFSWISNHPQLIAQNIQIVRA